jgi:hypothetical protein
MVARILPPVVRTWSAKELNELFAVGAPECRRGGCRRAAGIPKEIDPVNIRRNGVLPSLRVNR